MSLFTTSPLQSNIIACIFFPLKGNFTPCIMPPLWATHKPHLRLIFLWLCTLLLIYTFFRQQPLISNPSSIPVNAVDAVVFIAMGRMASENMVDYAIASVRKVGKFRGKIFVVSDSPRCFTDTVKLFDASVITVSSVKSIIEIKAMKTRLFEFLPVEIQSVLYMDVDILVTKNFNSFFRDLAMQPQSQVKLLSPNAPVNADMAAFLDAKGHYIGFCSGCEKWHTGILVLRRGSGAHCLQSWSNILLSGKYDTDQESLDETELIGNCTNIQTLYSRHLLFAKDYIGWIFTAGHTFIHVTAAGRLETQVGKATRITFFFILATTDWTISLKDSFYRSFVVPRIRGTVLIFLSNFTNMYALASTPHNDSGIIPDDSWLYAQDHYHCHNQSCGIKRSVKLPRQFEVRSNGNEDEVLHYAHEYLASCSHHSIEFMKGSS